MNIRSLLLLPFVVLVACSRPAPSLGTLKKAAEEMAAAYQARDYEEYVDRVYPTAIKEAGGRAEMIAGVRQGRLDLATRGGEIQEFSVGEPGRAVVSGGEVYVIVPTRAKIDLPTFTTTQNGYLLAISADNGATWKFLDSSMLTTARTYLLVPDLPRGLKFPPDEGPTVVRKPAPEPRPPTQSAARSALQIEAIAVANALVAGAYHEFVAGLYPPIVEGFGGPDKAVAIFRGMFWAQHDAGRLTVSSVEVGEPGEFATRASRTFAVVPVTCRGENTTKKYVRQVLLLAISNDGGASWKFIPGFSPEMAAKLGTSFLPPGLKIPEPSPPVITEKTAR